MTSLLENVRLFESCSESERAGIVRFMHERHLESGETVFTQGERGSTMLVVVQGTLSAVVRGNDKVRHEVAALPEHACIGEMFCIDPAPRPVTVMANVPSTVLELGRDDLIKMRQEAPRCAAALISAVFHETLRRLRGLDDRVERELRRGAGTDPDGGGGPPSSSVPGPWEECFARLRGSA